MTEIEGMRYGENSVSDEQFLSAPTTPSHFRGYLDHEDDHHEKKSVLAKVKDRAKKWRQMLAKKKHGSHEGESSPRSWGGNSDDDDDEEEDPEYHGAPMYESEMAPSAYKETASRHHSNTEPRLHDQPNISNTASFLHRTGDEPALHHLDGFKASNIMTNPPAFYGTRLESNQVPIKGISTTQHIMANSAAISTGDMENSPASSDEHQFEAKVRQKEAVDERLTPCIITNSPAFSHEEDVHFLQANNPTHHKMVNLPAIPDMSLLEADSKRRDNTSEETLNHHIAANLAAFSDIHYLEAGTKDEDAIRKKSSDHVIANRPTVTNKHLLVTDKGMDKERTLTETMSEMLTPAYVVVTDASHTIASKILCPTDGDERGVDQGLDPVKDLTDSVTGMLSPAYTAVSEASHRIASKIHGPMVGEEIANGNSPKGNKTLTETVTGIFTPAYTMVASKINGPTVEDEMGAKLALDPLTAGGSHKTLTETLSGMLAPAYTLVSDASHKITSKIQSPKHEDEIGAKHAWDKGVSVKEYLKQKLEPGEEERALSHVITETMSPKKSSRGQADEIGVVEKVRGAVCSLLQKGGHKESNFTTSSLTEHAGPILPVSTNPHSVEVEDRGGRRLQAYAN